MLFLSFVIIPLAAALIITLLGRLIKQLGYVLSCVACLATLCFSVYMLNIVQGSANRILVHELGGWPVPLGICLVFDGLSALMLVIINVVGLLVMMYSLGYMSRYTGTWKFYTLFMLLCAGMNGIVISGDLFNMYVFLEIASISAYALVAFGTEAEDLEASFKYIIMGAVASAFILLAIAILYSYASTLNMADMALVLSNTDKSMVINFAAVLFLAGFGLKAALVPFHAWLPDAHPSAPAPISAILSGVFIKTAGIYTMCRVLFNILGAGDKLLFILMVFGAISMAAAAFLAIAQQDIKRMFAYSSISQIGYIVFALGIGTPLAVFAGLYHMANHAIFKSLLFLNAGAIEYSTGTRDLRKLGGLNKRLPFIGATAIIGSLAIAGIPPLGGFFSKFIIIFSALKARYFALALCAALVSIVTLAYYLKFQSFALFGKPDNTLASVKGIPLTMKVSIAILAVLCAATGLLLLPQCKIYLDAAADSVLLGRGYAVAVLGAING